LEASNEIGVFGEGSDFDPVNEDRFSKEMPTVFNKNVVAKLKAMSIADFNRWMFRGFPEESDGEGWDEEYSGEGMSESEAEAEAESEGSEGSEEWEEGAEAIDWANEGEWQEEAPEYKRSLYLDFLYYTSEEFGILETRIMMEIVETDNGWKLRSVEQAQMWI